MSIKLPSLCDITNAPDTYITKEQINSQFNYYEEQIKEKDSRIEKLKEVIKTLAKELK